MALFEIEIWVGWGGEGRRRLEEGKGGMEGFKEEE
jgi:hypothetical protein